MVVTEKSLQSSQLEWENFSFSGSENMPKVWKSEWIPIQSDNNCEHSWKEEQRLENRSFMLFQTLSFFYFQYSLPFWTLLFS